MFQRFLSLTLLTLSLNLPNVSFAATQEEMVTFVKKAVQYIKENGKEAAFKKFSDHRDKDCPVRARSTGLRSEFKIGFLSIGA